MNIRNGIGSTMLSFILAGGEAMLFAVSGGKPDEVRDRRGA